MKARLNMSFATAGIALILLSGCVSSKKYKASQAELARVRNDSSQMAQQATSLNGNIHDLQDRNTTLQRSLDSSSTGYAAQQRSLDYYRGYFKEQQDTLTQVNEGVKGALTQAGVSNADIQQINNAIYVRVDESELFKKNSTIVTPVGKQVLNGLAQVIKNRSKVNVAVTSGDSAIAWAPTEDMPAGGAMNTTPKHHRAAHARRTTANTTTANTNVAGSKSSTASSAAPIHKKVHRRPSSEGSMATIYNGSGHMHNRAWALKQGRMVTVANHFLNNGVPKINVSLQHPPMNGTPQSTDLKIIITPKMENFNPQSNSSAAAGIR